MLKLSLSQAKLQNISVKRKQLAHGEAIEMLADLVGIDFVKKLCFISSYYHFPTDAAALEFLVRTSVSQEER